MFLLLILLTDWLLFLRGGIRLNIIACYFAINQIHTTKIQIRYINISLKYTIIINEILRSYLVLPSISSSTTATGIEWEIISTYLVSIARDPPPRRALTWFPVCRTVFLLSIIIIIIMPEELTEDLHNVTYDTTT